MSIKSTNTSDGSKLAVNTYEKIAQTYTQQYFDDLTDSPHLNRFLSKLPKTSKILDVGCGPGQFSLYFTNKGFDVIGIDFSKQMIEIARKKVPDVDFRYMDMRKLEFEKESFDGILTAYSLIHIPSSDLLSVLNSFSRILKVNGYLCIIVQKGEPDHVVDEPFKPDEKMFFNFFSLDRINDLLLKASFKIDYLEEHTSHDPDSMSDRIIVAIAKKGN
jgi:ubiquinone/menaquinone biosynthesis C-methylase UbiE